MKYPNVRNSVNTRAKQNQCCRTNVLACFGFSSWAAFAVSIKTGNCGPRTQQQHKTFRKINCAGGCAPPSHSSSLWVNDYYLISESFKWTFECAVFEMMTTAGDKVLIFKTHIYQLFSNKTSFLCLKNDKNIAISKNNWLQRARTSNEMTCNLLAFQTLSDVSKFEQTHSMDYSSRWESSHWWGHKLHSPRWVLNRWQLEWPPLSIASKTEIN